MRKQALQCRQSASSNCRISQATWQHTRREKQSCIDSSEPFFPFFQKGCSCGFPSVTIAQADGYLQLLTNQSAACTGTRRGIMLNRSSSPTEGSLKTGIPIPFFAIIHVEHLSPILNGWNDVRFSSVTW